MSPFLRRSSCIALVALGAVADDLEAKGNSPTELPLTASSEATRLLPEIVNSVRPVGLIINGQLSSDPVLIAGQNAQLLVRSADLRKFVAFPTAMTGDIRINGDDYVSLSSVTGLAARLSDDGTMLTIDADISVFPTARVTRRPKLTPVGEIVPAAFLSYDLVASHWRGQQSASAFVDTGLSGPWGLAGTTALFQAGRRGPVRLETFYQRDLPANRIRMVVGDTNTRAAEWNAPVRFAGVRIGSDFSLDPDGITFPIPSLAGSATQPSTVELLSAGARTSLDVQPGTFLIDYQPMFSGVGEVTMRITDSAGISREVSRSFYTSSRLLIPGLADYSIEAGFLRENFAVRSFDYGQPFGAAFARVGLSETLTASGRAEISPAIQMAGAALGWVLSPIGEFSMAGAVSRSNGRRGAFARVQFQRIAPTHSVTFSYQRDNGEFATVGQHDTSHLRARSHQRELAIVGTVSLGVLGHMSLGHIDARSSDGERYRATDISIARAVNGAYFTMGYRRTQFRDKIDQGAFLSASVRLGRRGHASFRVDDSRVVAIASRDVPNDQGLGVQVAASLGPHGRGPNISTTGILRTQLGDIELSGDWSEGGSGLRVNARGALVAVPGRIVTTPRIDDAFAIIELESDAPVTLYLENRPVAASVSSGKPAIIPGLQPYTENRISLDASMLPINADIDGVESLVVPGFRQAVKARFGGARGTSVTVAFVDQEGAPVPPGLDVYLGPSLVGLTGYDGLVYFEATTPGMAVSIKGQHFACETQLPPHHAADARRPVLCAPSSDPGVSF